MGWGQAGAAWRECAGASFGKLPAGAKLPDVFGGGARRSQARRPPSPPRNLARRDALGRRAAEGVPDSQSASEGRERAKPERAA